MSSIIRNYLLFAFAPQSADNSKSQLVKEIFMISRNSIVKVTLIIVSLAFGGLVAGTNYSQAQKLEVETAGQKFKSIKVLNDMPADQMGKVMNMISASLGVDCKFCHTSNDGDYEKEGVEHKETARKMMKMVFDLNKTQFNGRPEINCNSCHNGKSHPQPTFPLAPVAREERPKQPEKGPTADQIIVKFITALGGAERIGAIKSRLVKANRVEPDGKTIEPETIWLSDGSYRSDTAYGKYIVTEIFAGGAARKYGDWVTIELKPDETEQIRREGELFYPLNLKKTYSKMDFRSIEKINGQDAYLFTATTAGGLRERLAFDVASGFLLRRTASSPTIFGNFTYQVDYYDYKDFGGVKMPATTTYAVPNIRWTRKIIEVKNNVPVNQAIFSPPSGQ